MILSLWLKDLQKIATVHLYNEKNPCPEKLVI